MCKSVDSSRQARTLLAADQAVLLELEEVSLPLQEPTAAGQCRHSLLGVSCGTGPTVRECRATCGFVQRLQPSQARASCCDPCWGRILLRCDMRVPLRVLLSG